MVIPFNKKAHLTIGISIGILLALVFEHIFLHDVFYIIIGSLLPDIDHPRSTFGKYNPFVRFMKHRGKSHTIVGSLLLSLPMVIIGVDPFVFTFLGCLIHILSDKCYSFLPGKRKFSIRFW